MKEYLLEINASLFERKFTLKSYFTLFWQASLHYYHEFMIQAKFRYRLLKRFWHPDTYSRPITKLEARTIEKSDVEEHPKMTSFGFVENFNFLKNNSAASDKILNIF